MHRGTNPKINIDVINVDVSLIEDVRVTFKQGSVIIKKKKDDCSIADGVITTQLTEQETLQFKASPQKLLIQAKVKLSDGTIAATDPEEVKVEEILDEEPFDEVQEVGEEVI